MKLFTDKKVFKKYAWRGLISECPHCEKTPPDYLYAWHQPEWVDGVFLSLDMPNWKMDSCAVFSVCPVCQKKSWCHMKLHRYFSGGRVEDRWPEKIKDAIVAEYRARLHKGMRDWNASPCSTCSAITEVSTTSLYFARYCPAGSGGPLAYGETCTKRRPL